MEMTECLAIEFKERLVPHIMRLSALDGSDFSQALLKGDSEVRDEYVRHMTKLVGGVQIKAMLGDTSVVDQTTFDVRAIRDYLDSVTENLGPAWSGSGVSETRDEDIRRIFAKFNTEFFGHVLSVHLSVQYHALLYYKPDARVPQIQKELATIDTSAKTDREQLAKKGDSIIASRLRGMGHVEPDHMKLFEMLYNDESLTEGMAHDVRRAADDEGLDTYATRRDALFSELDSFLMEVYNTTAVIIDENRLVTGEDGFLYTADLEKLVTDKRTMSKTREAQFVIDDMPLEVRNDVLSKMRGLKDALFCAGESL